MSLPDRIGAYDDCFEQLDKALASGLRLEFATKGEASIFQMRLHQARSLQRDEHRRIYERNSPKWGTSEYDKLIVRSPREDDLGHWWVYLELAGSNILSSEPLGAPNEFHIDLTNPEIKTVIDQANEVIDIMEFTDDTSTNSN